jgi:subtilisin-like proprotein convertase family protein
VSDTRHTIPDPGSVDSPITVSGVGGSAPKKLKVHVDGNHDWRGDLQIDLLDPNGKAYRLKSTSGSLGAGSLSADYTVDASASPADGTWKLRVTDASKGSSGILTGWSLTFPTFQKTGAVSVPDNGSATSDIAVTGMTGNAPEALVVHVDATHEWLGELQIDLLDPNGKEYRLKSANGTDPGGTLDADYRVDASASPADGAWKLRLKDLDTGAVGSLAGWSLTFPAYENPVPRQLPDLALVDSSVTVAGVSGNASRNTRVYVDLTHDWVGDLEIYLVDPKGVSHRVKADSAAEGGGALRQIYTVDMSGVPANGTWKLRVDDTSDGGEGTLNAWSLAF